MALERGIELQIFDETLRVLTCVLAPVRNFFDVCFVAVKSNSVCGAEPVRSGTTTLKNLWKTSRLHRLKR